MCSERRRDNGGVWFASLLAIVLLTGGGTAEDFKSFKFSGFAQGTSYHITYFAQDQVVYQSQFEEIFLSLDSALSIYKPYSLINRFNNSVIGVKANRHLLTVVEKSLVVYKDSGGVFDITILPIMRAWGFGNNPVFPSPDSAAIKALMQCIGSDKLYLKSGFLGKSDPCVEIDVNGIAQGYSVDAIAMLLEKNGIRDYLVEVGGEIRVKGHRYPGVEPFRIGIEDPKASEMLDAGVGKVISLDHGAVTTSGIHGKQHKSGDVVVPHLMNPKTGFPLSNDMINATVIADNAMTADGYDNVLMGLGMNQALAFMERHKEMEAYIIYRRSDGSMADTATAGFYRVMEK